MDTKRVLISCGPIPARLDSVKFITNRFKGGLAFKTAYHLLDEGNDVTIVMWKHTKLPDYNGKSAVDIFSEEHLHVVTVLDVVEYCNWISEHASEFDAFIMAAAVANLMPSNPYKDKFPSHNYKVGDKFNIEFEIAPRAIDIVKTVNPRSCLIGYKLFDAKTDQELVDIARHTLHDSKANVIFANTPATAKTKKIALMQDNSVIPMDFQGHIEMIDKAIHCHYFKTIVDKSLSEGAVELDTTDIDSVKYHAALGLVTLFDKEFKASTGFGTIAIKTPFGMVTTSRGHSATGPVLVKNVNMDTLTITASGKATLNAPTLWEMLRDEPVGSYVIHRHTDDTLANPDYKNWETIGYEFPGTIEEVNAVKGKQRIYIEGHGYLEVRQLSNVDWDKYYEQFPSKYYSHEHPEITELIKKYSSDEYETLEVGGNTRCACKYNLDVNLEQSETNLNYAQLGRMKGHFDFILLRNCINYLTVHQLEIVKAALKPGGQLIANGFADAPCYKATENEVAVKYNDNVTHYLIVGDAIYRHTFSARNYNDYKELGFDAKIAENGKSMLIRYTC